MRMATTASATTTQWLPPLSQYTTSASVAVTPDTASGHQFVRAGACASAAEGAEEVRTSASKPSDFRAASTLGSASGVCATCSLRWTRLNSRFATPGTPASLPRINASSVGQSICWMDNQVLCWAAFSSIRTARIPMADNASSIGRNEAS